MKPINYIKYMCILISALLLFACSKQTTVQEEVQQVETAAASEQERSHTEPTKFFTIENGELIRPTDYRTWVYVGTPLTPNELNGGKAAFPEFHSVYIDPVSYEHWKKTGTFRDGTIMMKELISVGDKIASSGKGYFQGEFIGLEATIKSKKHFPSSPGNWAYYSFTSPADGILKDKATAFPDSACNTCHEVSAQDDFVFTQYYPVLRAAKGVGDVAPENSAKRAKSAGEAHGEEASAEPAAAAAAVGEPKRKKVFQATVATPENVASDIPVDGEKLFAFLKAKKYASYKYQEKENHPSGGPHSEKGKLGFPVRVYYNDIIGDSLKAGNEQHPVGAGIVKEMFSKDNKLIGWAVSVKTQADTADGKGWYWYEVVSTTDNKLENVPADGNGVPGCFGCHAIGQDMVRSNFSTL